MRKIICLFFVTAYLVLTTGCFNITEEVFFKSNGSGKVKMTIDMSEMMSMLSAFIPDSLKNDMDFGKEMSEGNEELERIKGISNVASETSEDYIYTLKYDFADMTALNRAMARDSDTADSPLGKTSNVFKKSRRWVCRSMTSEKGTKNALEEMDMEGEEMKEMMEMFNKPTYTFKYHLPNNVKKVKSKGLDVESEKDGKTATFTYNLFDFLESDGKIIDHEVKF